MKVERKTEFEPSADDPLTRYIQIQIALNEVINRFGISWTWVKKMKTELVSQIPAEGLDVDGYHISTTDKAVMARKGEGNPIYYEKRVQVSRIKEPKKVKADPVQPL